MDDREFFHPPEIAELHRRLAHIRELADQLGTQLPDLFFHAHDRGSSDDPKVTTSTAGYDQLAARRHAAHLWHELRKQIRAEETAMRAWLSRLQRILGEGEDPDPRFRPGRPVTDAELAEAQRQQNKREARGEYTPVKQYPQPGPVRR